MLRFEITFKGVQLEVEGIYTEGEQTTGTYQGMPEEFDIHHIYAGDVDIIDLFYDVSEFATAVLQKHY